MPLFGDRARTLGRLALLGLAALTIAVSFTWLAWLLVVSLVVGVRHPPVVRPEEPLGAARGWVCAATPRRGGALFPPGTFRRSPLDCRFDSRTMKVLCPSCERLVELVDLRVERGGLVARCPACGAEQRQELPARPVTLPSAEGGGEEGRRGEEGRPEEGGWAEGGREEERPEGGRQAAAHSGDDEDENDEGPTIILLTPSSQAVPLAVAPPGSADVPRPAEVARFESARPPAIAPVIPARASRRPPRPRRRRRGWWTPSSPSS